MPHKRNAREQQHPASTAKRQGLRSVGRSAKSPVFGLLMFLIASVIFGVLAYLLKTNEFLPQWDMMVAKSFRAIQINAPWPLMENMLLGCFLGKEVALLIGTILGIYFLYKRFWRELALVCIGLGGGGVIWYLLSLYFDRPRPTDHLPVLQLSGSSFPSGSAMMAVLCYGLCVYLLVPRLSSLFWKWLIALLSIVAILMVALSSLLFGTHYASDVIAGFALGLAWAGVAFTLVEQTFRDRTAEESAQEAISLEGLRAPGLFKQRPILGIAIVLLASLVVAALGYNLLAKGPLLEVDQSIYEELLIKARAAPPGVNDLMLFGFFLGKQIVQVIGAILSLYFLYQRYWREFGMIQISSQGGGLLWNYMIDYFARPRPAEQLGLETTTLPSFPSGHALGTMICYGFLAYLLVPKMPSRFWKWTLSIAIGAIVLFEGLSRIFHGNHYLTDVVAGYALGLAWLVLVCTALEWIFVSSMRRT